MNLLKTLFIVSFILSNFTSHGESKDEQVKSKNVLISITGGGSYAINSFLMPINFEYPRDQLISNSLYGFALKGYLVLPIKKYAFGLGCSFANYYGANYDPFFHDEIKNLGFLNYYFRQEVTFKSDSVKKWKVFNEVGISKIFNPVGDIISTPYFYNLGVKLERPIKNIKSIFELTLFDRTRNNSSMISIEDIEYNTIHKFTNLKLMAGIQF